MAARTLPNDLKTDVESFISLMLEKGDSSAIRDILKLKNALAVGSPVLDAHVNLVAKNALTPGIATFDLTHEERYLIGDLLNRLELWRDGKPGPPKQFPIRLELRISTAELDALGRIAKRGGIADAEGIDRSAIIRRLIHEADPGE